MIFSVIVPVHNGAKYIEDMMKPVIARIGKGIDFEVLLIENGSTDDTAAICDEYASKYPEVKSFHYGPIGAYGARREGIKNAQGRWLIFADADDAVSEEAISVLSDVITEDYKDCDDLDIVLYNAAYLDDKDKRKFSFPIEQGKVYRGEDKKPFYEIMCKNDSLNALWNKCVRREVAQDCIKDGDEDVLNHGEDLLQTAAFIDKARAIVYVDRILYYYRRNSEGLTGGYHPEYLPDQERAWEAFSRYTKEWVGDSLDGCIDARKALTCTIAVKSLIYSGEPVSKVKEKLKEILSGDFYNKYANLELPLWAPEEDVFVHNIQESGNPYKKLILAAIKYRIKTKIKRILKNGL